MVDSRTLALQTASLFLGNSANWRDRQAEIHPDDARNPVAARMLRDLRERLTFDDHEWRAIAPYFNNADRRWLKALMDTNRAVGFRIFPKDSSSYVANLFLALAKEETR